MTAFDSQRKTREERRDMASRLSTESKETTSLIADERPITNTNGNDLEYSLHIGGTNMRIIIHGNKSKNIQKSIMGTCKVSQSR
jgi:hypothetical protein